ncbi:MAG: helix-turn-helix domain-containing protein [Vicinamibacteria bacterium]
MQNYDLLSPTLNLKATVMVFERALIQTALVACEWNQRRAAVVLGVLPTTLLEKMQRLNLRPPAARWLRANANRPGRQARGETRRGSVPAIEIAPQVDSWCATCGHDGRAHAGSSKAAAE